MIENDLLLTKLNYLINMKIQFKTRKLQNAFDFDTASVRNKLTVAISQQ